MNYQDIFNKVSKHLLTQSEKSFIPNIGFKYRVSNISDPIGLLLGDVYTPELENHSLQSEEMINKLFQAKILDNEDIKDTKPAIRFLALLQNIHDNKDVSGWHSHLQILAYYYKLTFTQ